jgi:hypothetical protein
MLICFWNQYYYHDQHQLWNKMDRREEEEEKKE